MNAYVTLVTNADYLTGAVGLARSLQMVNARWPLFVMIVRDLPGLEQVEKHGGKILPMEPLRLSAAFRARHSRRSQHVQAPFTKGEKPLFHDPLDNFTKLRVWQLEQFESVVFLDADVVTIRNVDRLFSYPEFSAAPNVYAELADFHRLNSGVFVAKPNRATFDSMLVHLEQPQVFWRRTDQTFLQEYFPQWHGLPYTFNTLQYVWFNLPSLWCWESVHIIHYQYEKPWQAEHPKRKLLAPLIETWRHIYEHGSLPHVLAEPPHAPVVAPEAALRVS